MKVRIYNLNSNHTHDNVKVTLRHEGEFLAEVEGRMRGDWLVFDYNGTEYSHYFSGETYLTFRGRYILVIS